MTVPDEDRVPARPATTAAAALPTPPFVRAAGIVNLRDAGGYAVAHKPGKVVRRGVLFRSGDLTELGEKGVAALQQLGITQVFDLRSEQEAAKPKGASRAWPGATCSFVSVFLDQDYSPEEIAKRFEQYSSGTEGFVQAYSRILAAAAEKDHPSQPIQKILDYLASSPLPPSPLLVHCTAGKDRTGVLIALILALCGVDDQTISHEYVLSNLGFAPRREATVKRLIEHHFEGDRKRAETMVDVRQEYMLLTLASLRKTYGSVERYVVEHLGVPQETVARVRQNLVVDLAPGEEPLDAAGLAALTEATAHLRWHH